MANGMDYCAAAANTKNIIRYINNRFIKDFYHIKVQKQAFNPMTRGIQ